MAVDLFTGEHICMGLALGSGCESCRKKHPHLIPRSQEEIEANKRNLLATVAAYRKVLDSGEPITTAVAEDLNRHSYGGDNANRFEMLDPHEPGPQVREAASRTRARFLATFPTAGRLAPVVVSRRARPNRLARLGAAISRLWS